jgi:hypothetical protein
MTRSFPKFPPGFYRRNGTPYPDNMKGMLAWARDFENQKIRFVASALLPGVGRVSTVWLGIPPNPFGGAPLIFETAVFGKHGELDGARYATEAEAIKGHYRMVAKWSKRLGARARLRERKKK